MFVHLKRCNIPSISHLVLGGTQEPPAFPLSASALRTLADTHTPPHPHPHHLHLSAILRLPPSRDCVLCYQCTHLYQVHKYRTIRVYSTMYGGTDQYVCTHHVQTYTCVLHHVHDHRPIRVYSTMYRSTWTRQTYKRGKASNVMETGCILQSDTLQGNSQAIPSAPPHSSPGASPCMYI